MLYGIINKMGGCNMLMLGLVVMVVMSSLGEAQVDTSCTQQLAPCLDFINSTNPPNTCCNPLKDIATNDLLCLCELYTNPAFLESFGINITPALRLTRRCGVNARLADCKALAPPPTPVTPPATPGADGGGAGRVACTGLSFLLPFWAFMLFN